MSLYKIMRIVIQSPRGKLTAREYYNALWNYHSDRPNTTINIYKQKAEHYLETIINNFTDIEIWNRMQKVYIYLSKELYNKTFINIQPIINRVLSEDIDSENYEKYKLNIKLDPISYNIDDELIATNLPYKTLNDINSVNETAMSLCEAKNKLDNISIQLKFQIFLLIYFEVGPELYYWSKEANYWLLNARNISIKSLRGKFTAKEYYDGLFNIYQADPETIINEYKSYIKNFRFEPANNFTDVEIWNRMHKVFLYLSKELYNKKFQDIKPIINQVLSEEINKTNIEKYNLSTRLVPIKKVKN
jgi:hypothetical protein